MALLNLAINTPAGEERRRLWQAFREAQADLRRYRQFAREEEEAIWAIRRRRRDPGRCLARRRKP